MQVAKTSSRAELVCSKKNPEILFVNEINLSHFICVLGLRLIVHGEAQCSWTVTKRWSKNNSRTTYRGTELYLNSITYVFGSKHGESMEIDAGVHTYNFSCQLPSEIPFSIEGKHGHVRYRVETNLDVAWALDLSASRVFNVNRYEDLNRFPHLQLPIKSVTIKNFCSLDCSCYCKPNKLSLSILLPRTGFAVGEVIPVGVEIINESSVSVRFTTIVLNQVGVYTSQTPRVKTLVVRKPIVRRRGRGVKAGKTDSFTVNIEIPQNLTISSNNYCKVFRISYELELEGVTYGLCSSPKVSSQITLGTVGIKPRNEFLESSAAPSAPEKSNFQDSSRKNKPFDLF